MVEIDWNTFTGIKPERMTEKEKDDLCDTVTWYIPDINLDRKYLIHFVRIIQEVLKFKAEQVELLTNELDDLAAREGKAEGSKLHQYLEEIEQLKEEVQYLKKFDGSSKKSTFSSDDELRREVIKLEIQNEDLLVELKEKEKELLNEKEEVEKFAAQVATLEREKQELARELRVLQDEATEKSNKSVKDSPETGAEKQELTEVIRHKNRHISQLLEDMEVVEEENLSLRTKLTNVRDELSETTTQITGITAELAKLKHLNEEYKNKNSELEERIKSLLCQIEELVEEKSKHDRQLDEYILMFNTKLQEWNDEVDAKDEEILKLKDEMKKLSSPRLFTDSNDRDGRIAQLEKEIGILQQELMKATEEINSSSELIEKLKEKQLQSVSAPVHIQSAEFFQERIKLLEEKLNYAEEDALVKAEEMSDLIIQLREYESGVFGLPEAVLKIKKLEKHIQEKDLQIEKLVEICNNLEIKLDNFEEQNMAFRARLGLSVSDEIDTTGVKLRYEKDEELMENLKLQLDRKEEELIKAKLKYRKVVKFLKLSPHVECPKAKANPEISKKLEIIIKENDALRKGMHEILESIREQDRAGTVEVQSTCLERLLEALDSRHVSGWYHPAMRLQAQLSTEEGKNEELRNQIRCLRTEEKKRMSELQNAYLKIQSLESDLSTPRYEEKVQTEEPPEPPPVPKRRQETPLKAVRDQKTIELESRLQETKLELDRKKVDMELLERNFGVEKEKLLTQLEELECQNRELKVVNPDSTKLADLTSQVVVLERKISFLQNSESACRENNEILKQKIIEEEEQMLREILRLQNDKSKLVTRTEELEESILNTVSREKYNALSKELAGIKTKYQNAVSLVLVKGDDAPLDLQAEVRLLHEEKQVLLDELKETKKKLIATEGLLSEDSVTKGDLSNEISVLADKLATCEVKELNERQKSAHLERINGMLKTQLEAIETRNGELLGQVTTLAEEIEKHQTVERNLRMRAVDHFSEEGQEEFRNKLKNLEKKCSDLAAEKDNIEELFEISQSQCRAFQEWRDSEKIVLSSLTEQIVLLQSTHDDKVQISRLSHELTVAKLSASQLSKKNNDLKMKMSKLLSQNVSLELKIEEGRQELIKAKRKHAEVIEYMYEAMDEVRGLYAVPVRFRDMEDFYSAKLNLKEKERELLEKAKELKTQIHEYSVKKEEMETQLESLQDLKDAFKGDAKNLIAWHNKTTELKLKEAKSRRENEHLLGEISQLENRVWRLDEEISSLEEGAIEREKEWERKQVLWEKAQLKARHEGVAEGEKGVKSKKVTDIGTNTEDLEENSRIRASQLRIEELEAEVLKLRKSSKEEEEGEVTKEELPKEKAAQMEGSVFYEQMENPERDAFKVTVQSLQNIIKQKEETILRYQDLLKEGRDEYSRACAKLQEELRELNDSLTAQNKAYNQLKNRVQANHFANENVPPVVEKYFGRIQELEEELRECQMSLTSMNSKARTYQQEVEKWKNLADERLLLMEDMKQRVGGEGKAEADTLKEELKRYQKENERLNQFIDLLRSEGVRGVLAETSQLQEKFHDQESHESEAIQSKSDVALDKLRGQRREQDFRELDSLRRQLKFARDESTRLREQIRVLQSCRRPKTGGSSTSRSESRSSVKEESLTNKIKHLEELLTVSKEREKELMEMNMKKLKSTEEVARWDERKKSQKTIQSLTEKLKEKEAEVEVLRTKNESFRNMVYKCERDKSVLESQLKAAKGGPSSLNARVEKLNSEKKELEAEVIALKNTLEEQMRHSGGIGAALLQEKLEEQERKLVAFQLASMGQNAVMEELERVKAANSNLEKANLRLESENLSLQLKLEKEKGETKFLLEKAKHYRETTDQTKRQESGVNIAHLNKMLEKVTEENRRLRSLQKEPRCVSSVQKIRTDLARLREDHESLRGKYAEAIEKNVALEEEVKSCRYQIHLMEEKDLAEVLTRKNYPSTCELSRELSEVRAKLAHKTHLLSRVKALLVKAAAKEKALVQQVTFLRSVSSKSALQAPS